MPHFVKDRILVRVDIEGKNWHSFANGTTIRLERQFDNFNRRQTEQVLGTVVSAEDVPSGALILFNHNSLHEVNEVFNHGTLSGEDIASGVKLYSLPQNECYVWKLPGEAEWQPLPGFAIALRVFKKYTGAIEGIAPSVIKDVLFVISGEFHGHVVRTLIASDYQIIFRNEAGVEESIIRFRPDGDEKSGREPEAIAVLHDLTDEVWNGNLLVGYSPADAKTLQTTTNEITSAAALP